MATDLPPRNGGRLLSENLVLAGRRRGRAVARPHATSPPRFYFRQNSTRLVHDGDGLAHGPTTLQILIARRASECSCLFAMDSIPHLTAMDRHPAIGFKPETVAAAVFWCAAKNLKS